MSPNSAKIVSLSARLYNEHYQLTFDLQNGTRHSFLVTDGELDLIHAMHEAQRPRDDEGASGQAE